MTTHQAIATDLGTLMQWLDGKKVYVGCVVAALVIVATHLGIQIPGVVTDPSENWLVQLWGVWMVASGRSAMNKLIPTGGQQ